MNRTDRMLGILLELQSKGLRRAEDLAETFEVSKRSIYRDVEALSMAGVPVVAVPGQGYSLMEGFFLPPLSFTVDEATMLLIGGDVVAQNFDEAYRSCARSAMTKLAAVLPPALRADVDELLDSIRFVRTGCSKDTDGLEKLGLLRHAVIGRRSVRFRYSARSSGLSAPRTSLRGADPYALCHIDGSWYVVAHCHLRKALRTFRVSRIGDLEITDATFTRPAGFRPTAPPAEEIRFEAEVVFPHDVMQWVRESGNFYKAEERLEEDGLHVTLRARSEEDLVPWILSWGANARVLRPHTLAERVSAAAKKIVAVYETREHH